MKALITGASSGIGKEMALYLSWLGYELYVVSRDKHKLEEIYQQVSTKVVCIELDLKDEKNCRWLYQELKNEKIDLLINNAGFGDCGKFMETSLDKELDMISLNICAYHILTKLFVIDFVKRGYGRILNVASMAGFMPGPYMATYYATKAYVVNLSLALAEELKQQNSNVKISVFCPGPVHTNFSEVANVQFKIPSLSKKRAAKCAIDGMFRNQLVIIPMNMKVNYILTKISPIKVTLKINSKLQKPTYHS